MAFTLLGIVLVLLKIRGEGIQTSRMIILILLATFVQGAALLFAVPLPWPRYVIPMMPFVCIWIAFGISQVISGFRINTKLQ